MMTSTRILGIGALLVSALVLSAGACSKSTNTSVSNGTSAAPANSNVNNANAAMNASIANNVNTAAPANVNATAKIVLPIAGFYDRVTKKPFGIYITSKTSPVQPERFSGYHAGADAETTSAEQSIDVPVYSIADGTVMYVNYVSGYGGVVMIQYDVNGETVTALYGHVRSSSVTAKKGDAVTSGQQIAVLGTGYSAETDGERTHLHFALLKGASTNVKGYMPQQSQLSAWYDPVQWLRDREAVTP